MSRTPITLFEKCATCSAACPVHTDTREYVDLIARGRYEEAFEVIRRTNPFPSVCSLICHHPCEEACRRANVDEPVALRNLKRFAVEQSLEHRKEERKPAEITREKSVGIVGAGPAGLTAAADLIRNGFPVTVYESLPRPGGMLSCAIPKYRLPDEAIRQDLDDIEALGVKIETGVRIGEDKTLDDLQKSHDAIILAIGLSESRMIPLENGDHPGVRGAIDFLQDTALGRKPDVADHVLVVGGGNVAVDAARTAIRLGAKSVKMVCLESESEMPAWDWECHEALEEGISFIHRQGPLAVELEDGTITGLKVRAVERVFDDDGRFAPAYFDDQVSTVAGGMVIVAIGQASDFSLVENTPVERDERGLLRFDPQSMSTSEPGIFACGEVVTGPGAAIEAVASGHRAAKAAKRYMETGAVEPVGEEELPEEVGELPEEVVERTKRLNRIAMPTMPPAERIRGFMQFELGYDEPSALAEARRCLSCTAGAAVDEDKCEACLTCLRVCPFGVPAVDDVATMCSEMCQACGLCAVECPARAISIRRFAVGDIKDRVSRLLGEVQKPVREVLFSLSDDANSRIELQDRLEGENGSLTAVLPLSTTARLEEVDLLKPFEYGAESVRVRMCDATRFHGSDNRLRKRVERTRGLLAAIGIDPGRLAIESGSQSAHASSGEEK